MNVTTIKKIYILVGDNSTISVKYRLFYKKWYECNERIIAVTYTVHHPRNQKDKG